jgi:hypothetical protein
MAIKVFTLTELFGWYIPMPEANDHWEWPKPCLICGAAVFKPNAHQKWHNTAVEGKP